jgi:post-segregation antitoxin (ccd killing protein)
MAWLNVYVPDELAERARAADLNLSALTQAAITDELQRRATDAWLTSLPSPTSHVSHEAALAALDAGRAEAPVVDASLLTTDHRLARASTTAEAISAKDPGQD